MQLNHKICILTAIAFLFTQCGKDDPTSPAPAINIPSEKGLAWLSEYNFFVGNLAELNPNTIEGVVPYDLNTALFSDYASKKRFIYVPNGSSIPFDTASVLDLPIGSVLIKHFYYPHADGTSDYIETRLLIRKADGWQPEIYEWNDDQTDASRTVVGGTKSLNVNVGGLVRNFNYLIPNQNQCKNCHAYNAELRPIGPTIHNLNKDYIYPNGIANQIDAWVGLGILDRPNNSNIPSWSAIDDPHVSLNERARAYLDVNCSSCHRREGSAANSGFYLAYDNQDSLSLGIWKTPVAAGNGSGGLDYVIHPGHADESILLYRMMADEVDERMPEIGRELLHDEGIELIRKWINSL